MNFLFLNVLYVFFSDDFLNRFWALA